MIIQRKKYLDMLISGEGNNLVKIVTGVRRCGKSFLLFKLFRNYLTEKGVDKQHIIELSLDDLFVTKNSAILKLCWNILIHIF